MAGRRCRQGSERAALAAAMLLAAGAVGAPPRHAPAGADRWIAAWTRAPTAYNSSHPPVTSGPSRAPAYAPAPPYTDRTVRQVVRLAAPAEQLRLRLSNEFSTDPLRIRSASIALADRNGGIVPGSSRSITFAGQAGVEGAPGAPLLSDPIAWRLPALSRLAISLYYADATEPPAHTLYVNEAWQAGVPGDLTTAVMLAGARRAPNGVHASEIDAVSPAARCVLVAFGDSITEGVGSTMGQFRGWPDLLAGRLASDPTGRRWSIVNQGVGSNRLLHDTPSQNALARFDRDVLAVPGTAAVLILLGINDIQYGHRDPAERVDADEIIAAIAQLATRAHARGLTVIGATITPFGGSPDFTQEGEDARQAVNGWIRHTALLDTRVDFDAALRDPADPRRVADRFDSGGHLHPNDAGYAAMAAAIPTAWFTADRAAPGDACALRIGHGGSGRPTRH